MNIYLYMHISKKKNSTKDFEALHLVHNIIKAVPVFYSNIL